MKKIIDYMNSINEYLAIVATKILSSMWTAWAFLTLVMIPFIIPSSQSLIMFCSSSVLQLISLPLLAVGQQVLSKGAERRALSDHNKIVKEFKLMKNLIEDAKIKNEFLEEIISKLDALNNKIETLDSKYKSIDLK